MVIIMGLSKIEIITGMQKFNGLKRVLSQAGVGGMTFTQVLGCGREKGTREYEVDERYEMELLPKQQINVVVDDSRLDEILNNIKIEGKGNSGSDQKRIIHRTHRRRKDLRLSH